jgi:CelD/BcsL family acetyltransferase involved in cellulose biosynthesis
MSPLVLTCVNSVADLRRKASLWDDLWWRSEVVIPTARVELLTLWLERFAPDASFYAPVVEQDGKWIAALPLVRGRVARVFRAAYSPGFDFTTVVWVHGGGLLADRDADLEGVMIGLVRGLTGLSLVRLEDIALDSPHWRAFRDAATRAGMANSHEGEYQVGWIDIDHDWDACRIGWSRSHRQRIAKALRRLAEVGQVNFKTHNGCDPEEVEAHVRRGFEIEDRSWKGEAGGSVIRRGHLPFYLEQAKQLARWRQLELNFLELDRKPIAFLYSYKAKGVYQAFKIAFDPQYAEHSPGHILLYHTLESLYRDPECRAIDFMGPIADTAARWRPSVYRKGNLTVIPRAPGPLGRAWVCGYRHLAALWSRIRSRVARRRRAATTA